MTDCEYCHNYKNSKGKTFGKTMHEHIQWWDWIRKTKIRKRVITTIMSPENKNPRLRSQILFRDSPESVLDMKIRYCPMCGRKLGGSDEENH